ncbi:MAG: LLM class flavin-dependent oxidoreductase [Actinophytocola sp.]|uniref:LLM class flavin-dependent oxidoreductase n=1 Tax=Actinophytocola sp. TaxID=1872138 RepID=UPI003C72D947
MDLSIGLPTSVPGVDGSTLLEFARRADRAGFAGLGVIDRLVYDNYEALVTLAAAAAVTERIRLTSTVLLASYRGSAAVLAKQLATIDRICGGRLAVGLAAGDREDDFVAAGARFSERGRRLDAVVDELRAVWAGDEVGPAPVSGGPPLLFGGHSDAAMRRAARHGTGWIAGGSSGTAYRQLVARVRRAWAAQGRSGRPRIVSLSYVSLGADASARAGEYLRRYYSYLGQKAEMAVSKVATTPDRLRAVVAEYAEAGCDELVLFPCTSDPEQVDLVAKEVLS